jgi:hypothetical protein
MAQINRTYTLPDESDKSDFHNIVDSATVSDIINADISSDAAITDIKLETISTAGKVSGAAITGLNNIPSAAGVIPAANLTSVAQKGANSDITSLSGLTTALSAAQGGTGATAAANAANGVVVPTGAVNAANGAVILDAAGKLPALDGSALTGLSSVTQVNDTDAGTSFSVTEVTFLSVAKTCTSGKTIFLSATGDLTPAADKEHHITLKQGSTVVQVVSFDSGVGNIGWATSGIVTGLSGSITFSVTIHSPTSAGTGSVAGKLTVLEF